MREAIVRIEKYDGTVVTGRVTELGNSAVEVRRQRKVMPEVFLEDYIRASIDDGEPIWLEKADIKSMEELKYDQILFVGSPIVRSASWPGFYSYKIMENGLTQYCEDGTPKIINGKEYDGLEEELVPQCEEGLEEGEEPDEGLEEDCGLDLF